MYNQNQYDLQQSASNNSSAMRNFICCSSCAIYVHCSAALFRCFLKASPSIVKHMHSEKVAFRIVTFYSSLFPEVVARAARCEKKTVFKVVARATRCEKSYSKVVARVHALTRT